MPIPTELFTVEAMTTLTGATGAVFVISNGCQSAFNFNPKWLGLVVAQIISIVGVLSGAQVEFVNVLVAIVNGFLIYSSAAGATAIGNAHQDTEDITRSVQTRNSNSQNMSRRRFFTPWF